MIEHKKSHAISNSMWFIFMNRKKDFFLYKVIWIISSSFFYEKIKKKAPARTEALKSNFTQKYLQQKASILFHTFFNRFKTRIAKSYIFFQREGIQKQIFIAGSGEGWNNNRLQEGQRQLDGLYFSFINGIWLYTCAKGSNSNNKQ